MDTIITAFKSRMFWTVVAMFLVGGTAAINSVLPDSFKPVVELGLGLLATYFHLNPSQAYGK